ncbi:MAG: DUF885 domain-containing protein [Promethearchaeota archaeon]
MDENQKYQEISKKIVEIVFKYNPNIAAYLGKEEYEKEVSSGTREYYEEFVTQFTQAINELKQLDVTKLNLDNRLAFNVLEKSHAIFQFLHETFPLWKKVPLGVDDIQTTIFVLLQRKGPTNHVAEVVIAQLSKLPNFLEEFRSRFDSPIPSIWKETALIMIQFVPSFFQFLANVFNSSNIPESLKESLSKAIKEAEPAIKVHTDWIQRLPVDEDEFAWALGTKNFEKLLSLRQLPWDRGTILKKGYALLESLTNRAKKIAKEIDPSKSYEEVIEDLKAEHPPTFEMVLEHARSESERAKEFITNQGLATIPEESLVVAETPLYLTPVIPFAMYGPTPYFDPKQPGIYYITPTKDDEGLKRHSYADISNVMVHEAYPGHHLDFVWNNKSAPLSNLIAFYFSLIGDETVEGWAHYCEEMMLQQGFHEDPKKAELVILRGQIWRAVRIVVDIELHCKQRTVEDAVKMLVEKAQMEAAAATAEVRRYTASPAQPLSYLIGKLLIQELKQDIEQKMGDKFNLKFFHDTILQSGDLPYSLLKELFEEKIKDI